ncbi:YciI family protein [Streptomyces sp. NPDC058758]|uniref:YciI family protein n=1 Tax=Streptomyces sp. NPDC058758 TaxID=3346627 RepID=UPI0036AD6BAF
MNTLNEEPAASGEMLDGRGLADPGETRPASADAEGGPVVTDEPYAETKEVMAGHWVLECASLDRVTEIAARVARRPQPPGAPSHPVVIRRIDETGPARDRSGAGPIRAGRSRGTGGEAGPGWRPRGWAAAEAGSVRGRGAGSSLPESPPSPHTHARTPGQGPARSSDFHIPSPPS